MKTNIRNYLVNCKNRFLPLLLLWNELNRYKFKYAYSKQTDVEAINELYLSRSGCCPNLTSPNLFSEKLQVLKLEQREQIFTKCVDKLSVREFIESKGLSRILNELYFYFDSIKDFDVDLLPEKFVVKGAHGSGWNLVCENKNNINWFWWKRIFQSWLKQNIYYNGREWPYKNCKPMIVIEKYLEDEFGELRDYKFHCFNGEPQFIQVNAGRFTDKPIQNFYDLEWQFQNFGKDILPDSSVHIPAPSNLKEMINIARTLSADFKYVRVDLYDVSGHVVFGELTFYPASGLPDFTEPATDVKWGELLDISR